MSKTIHPISGTVALITILSFWLSTIWSEAFAAAQVVTTVKTLIPYGFFVLVPALMAAGGSGFRLGKRMRSPLIDAKKKRMPLIVSNGILILIPSALYLSFKAQTGAFDMSFYVVQAIELMAGAVNITLLGLNMRDGLRLSRRRTRRPDAKVE
ncbi:hypothetical protein [Aquicoccus porphyridii]|uniref:Transmembrane protein n=1 Tax=Aquicoccus porphyridii TaxID=1852029 RepID=A0A5A9YX23_9RHOB|nr:hypothetical protein [Aquicoccus porphyridii]KAA0909512.1 hypothetical protein FLO80_21200 [Aquicoccus porphyridii]RAI52013.1 hypothetical protein DOO74_20260 [Rhodobacteraceae bacterium AsT-22]